jgi:predicted GNAT family acetyltransferase
MAEVKIEKNEALSRYEAYVDGDLGGFAEYELGSKRIRFTHTEVDDAFEGHGVGSELARAALDDVRREGTHQVIALCPFIKKWIDEHPDYQDLLA